MIIIPHSLHVVVCMQKLLYSTFRLEAVTGYITLYMCTINYWNDQSLSLPSSSSPLSTLLSSHVSKRSFSTC